MPATVSNQQYRMESAIKEIISHIGDNPNRDGLKDTPTRVFKSWKEMFEGYNMKAEDYLKVFDVDDSGIDCSLVHQTGINFCSFCEHHMLPFYGTVDITYVPFMNKRVGLSKLSRVVDCYAKRLQVQERMTHQIASALYESKTTVDSMLLSAKGVRVVSKAIHFCMECRGVRQTGAETTCTVTLGKI